MRRLAERVSVHLKERAFCVVFEDDLQRCWPNSAAAGTERDREIQAFAESHGWAAVIIESGFGMRAIFYRLEPGVVGHEGSRLRGRF
jgi:hypothetical protein